MNGLVRYSSEPTMRPRARSKTLSSLAAIDLAQPLREAYDKVKLVEPLAANLKKKKASMETLLKAYADASADGAAEAVTAATFHTAALRLRSA